MGALKKVGSLQRARWWNDPATLPALGRDRYEASVRTSRVMEEGLKNFMPLGCAATNPRRRSRSTMVASVAVDCALASAQVIGGQDAPVHAPTIVKEIAYRYLQLFLLGGGGGWRRIGGGVLGSRQAEDGRVIDGRRCGRLDAVRAKVMQQGVDIVWVGEREDALGAIVRDGKAQELGRNGVGFDMVEAGKTGNEIVIVVTILVFNAKIVDN